MRIHPIPPMCWGGLLTFSMDKVEAVFEAMKIWQETIQTEDESAWIMMLSKPIGGGEVSLRDRDYLLIGSSIRRNCCLLVGISAQLIQARRDTKSSLILVNPSSSRKTSAY